MRKICIVTGSRAEWGLLYPLAVKIKKTPGLKLQIIATGSHVSSRYGNTYKEIEKDGFKIDRKIKIPLSKDTSLGIIDSVSSAIKLIARTYSALCPDIIVLLGDRFEIFSAATAALLSGIKIAHIHGGEVTKGSLDDTFRHAITKMSSVHFTSSETYRKRVIQMGEHPSCVFNVGALGIDNIKKIKPLTKRQVENRLNLKFGRKNILVTFNPATAEDKSKESASLKNLFTVLDSFKEAKVIFTMPNPDVGAHGISEKIKKFVKKHPENSKYIVSMGRLLYLSSIRYMDVVAGNSSSGIIEVPYFGVPTVNIGSRQEGRIKPASVIDADSSLGSIKKAFSKALSAKSAVSSKRFLSPYGRGNAADKIVSVLLKKKIYEKSKTFYDVK